MKVHELNELLSNGYEKITKEFTNWLLDLEIHQVFIAIMIFILFCVACACGKESKDDCC